MRRPDVEWTVYGLIDPSSGRIRYVGLTGNLAQRMAVHRRCGSGRWGRPQNDALASWFDSLRAIGLRPDWVVLGTASSRLEALDLEAMITRTGISLGWALTNELGTGLPSRWAKKRAAKALANSASA